MLLSSVTPYLVRTHDNPEGIDPEEFGKIGVALREDRPMFLQEFSQKFFGRSTLHHTVSAAMLERTQAMAFTIQWQPLMLGQ